MTEQDLQDAGIENAERGLRYINELAGQGVTDDDIAPLIPLLLTALRGSPDPDRALSSLARWFDAVSSRYSYLQVLLRHPVALDLFCLVTGSSQYFADLLVRHPEYFEIIANPGVRGGTKTAATLSRELSALLQTCQRPELKRDVLRRWKAREMLRIGVRDLVGLAGLPATAREFSNLADACVQAALEIAFGIQGTGNREQGTGQNRFPISPDGMEQDKAGHSLPKGSKSEGNALPVPCSLFPVPYPFAVIGMGKLGGQELNYSSDIDLIFVYGDDLPPEVTRDDGRKIETTVYLLRVAEAVVKVLTEETTSGHVFRVDMRLRPEGRFGPLARSLASCRAYYESWAEGWERQAMVKARFLAGDRALGEAFGTMAEEFAYRKAVSAVFLEEIRENKRRIEKKCALEGQTETNVKTGYGGIRDIEFIVQKRQLEFGGRLPRLRVPGTLAALQRLRHAALLSESEAVELADDYTFLRNLEHRLQLLNGFQTQTMPPQTDTRERTKLARRMGYTSREAFESDLQRRRDRTHAHLKRLFYGGEAKPETETDATAFGGPFLDWLDALETPAAQERLADVLTVQGFRNIPAALQALRLPMRGNEFGEMPPDTPVAFKKIASRLLGLLAAGPDPDAGLAGIELLAGAVPNRAQLYAALADSPQLLERLVLLASASPPLLRQLTRRLEWFDDLLAPDEEDEDTDTSRADVLTANFRERLHSEKATARKLLTLARLYQRERLRAAARDVWEEDDVAATMRRLTSVAEATLQSLLTLCREEIITAHAEPKFARAALSRVAAIGLGKLGGVETGYSSDWDLVFVYDHGPGQPFPGRSNDRFALANTLIEKILAAEQTLNVQGAGLEIDLRLRPWGKKGALLYSLAGYADYYRKSGETWERQAALKARYIAGNPAVGKRAERLFQAVSFGRGLTAAEDAAIVAMKQRIETERLKPTERHTDLKLGHGGLTDIEWLAQRLQLLNGPRNPTVREPNTIRALSALATLGVLTNAETDTLTAAYLFLARLRNATYLQSGHTQDTLPTDPARRRPLARLLGYQDTEITHAEDLLSEETRHTLSEVRQIFTRRFPTQNAPN